MSPVSPADPDTDPTPADLRERARLRLENEAATDRLAARLAPVLRPGDTLLLSGGLGAGKTRLARALIQALQSPHRVPEDVPSPSFTLVQTYEAGPLEIWHCDLYRLTSAEELVELGLDDAFGTALCLIEWPERLREELPAAAVWLRMDMVADTPGVRILRLMSAQAGGLADRVAVAMAAA